MSMMVQLMIPIMGVIGLIVAALGAVALCKSVFGDDAFETGCDRCDNLSYQNEAD